ncbi:MAG: nucleotidyltransferase domain-containing protein [Desulfobacterales bacterium]|nr:nucleotidyltransferase domain-containing protein [Desulfobacterales bacterium]
MDIKSLKTRIISIFKAFNPDKIILFGSIAGENWDEASDIDLIIVYETDKRFMERLKELYLSWDIPKAVDILAYTPAEFEKMIDESFFMQDAMREGQVIYERN